MDLLPEAVLARLSVTRREREWRERLEQPGSPRSVLLAERDGTPAGFCSVLTPSRDEDTAPGTAEIEAIYVDPKLWRRGVGRALMDESLSRLRTRGWREVTLWMFDGNTNAQAFYAPLGFAPDGAEHVPDWSGKKEIRLRASLAG
jgi:GNAT superfamily N-acetyltransferase